MRGPLKLLGYPLLELGKLLIRLGAWCLGGTSDIKETISYEKKIEDYPVFDFLLGSGTLDGAWYGGEPPVGQPKFWWRKQLRSAFEALSNESKLSSLSGTDAQPSDVKNQENKPND